MEDRPSMWSMYLKAEKTARLVCPKCQEDNQKLKRMLEFSDDGSAYCNVCGASWKP